MDNTKQHNLELAFGRQKERERLVAGNQKRSVSQRDKQILTLTENIQENHPS